MSFSQSRFKSQFKDVNFRKTMTSQACTIGKFFIIKPRIPKLKTKHTSPHYGKLLFTSHKNFTHDQFACTQDVFCSTRLVYGVHTPPSVAKHS